MKITSFIIVISLFLVVTACQTNPPKTPVTLTINYPMKSLFYERVGNAFESKFPNIQINVTSGNPEKDASLSDIIVMNSITEYKKLVGLNKLIPLQTYLSGQDQLMSKLSPITIEPLQINGEMYGLTPSFDSEGIFFNKDLFEKYGVPLPTDQMSWHDILELAQRFPSKTNDGQPLVGFKSNYYEYIPFALILRIGQTENLTFIDPTTLKIEINTKSWKNIAEGVVDAVRNGSISIEDDNGSGQIVALPILTGNAAMELASYTTAYNFNTYQQNYGGKSINWGVVTPPIDPNNPDYSDFYKINEIFGISSQTNHKDEAWTFIKFITSDTHFYQTNINNLLNFGLPAMTEFIQPIEGHDLSPLFTLKPTLDSVNPYDEVNYKMINAFKQAGQKILDEWIQDNHMSIDEAFTRIQNEGQQAVDAAAQKLESSSTPSN